MHTLIGKKNKTMELMPRLRIVTLTNFKRVFRHQRLIMKKGKGKQYDEKLKKETKMTRFPAPGFEP